MNYNNNKNSTLDNSDSFKKNKQNNSEAFLSYLEKYLIKRELKHFLIYYNQWIEKEKIGKNLFTFVKEINIISKNIKQLNNFYFISYFNDEIFIYDRFFEKKFNYNFDSPISYISEIKYENAEKLFIIISVEDGRLCKIKFENTKININIKYIYINFEFILEIKKNFYILTNNKGTFYYYGLIFDFRKGELKEISEEKLKVGIVLDNRNVLLFNNKNNRGIIYIFNSITKKLNKKNINESFILSQNCIKLLKLENIKDIKILICGIKKYYQEQKNGFIIFKIKSEDNELIFENFIYDTDNYIINSFLSLKKLNKNNLIFIKKNNKIYNTKYIFVSWSNEENEDNQIENRLYYIDEIENNKPQKEFTKINFSNIKPIKDSFKMFQSEINGNLFIISSDDKLNEFEVNYQSLM